MRSLPSGMKLMGLLVISPAVFKVQQGDGVKPHVSVVVHGEREGKAAVVDKIVIPFLDAQLARLDIGAAVYREELFGVAGLVRFPLPSSSGMAFGDLVLHMTKLPSASRISCPTKWSREIRPRLCVSISADCIFASSSSEQLVLIIIFRRFTRRVFMRV